MRERKARRRRDNRQLNDTETCLRFKPMDQEFTKDQIESLILSDSNRVTYQECKRKKLFSKILVDKKYSNYVKCNEYINLYVAKYNSGASLLIHHENSYHKNHGKVARKQPTLEYFVPTILESTDKTKVSRAAAICAATDLLPFSFVEGAGMKRFVDMIADICQSKRGKVTADQLLCSRKTVKNHVMKTSDEIRAMVKEELASVDKIHATCDHWKETKTCRDFFTVTIHFVYKESSNIKLKSSVIATIETGCKTAAQIKADSHFDRAIRYPE